MSAWQSLGNLLGGGIDREGAYQEGMQVGAQTQSALAQARVRQMDAVKKRDEYEQSQNLAQALMDMGAAPDATAASGMATILRSGAGNFQQLQSGRQTGQTMGFREEMAAPETDFARAQQLRMAGGDAPFNPVGTGGGLYWDLMNPNPHASAQVTPGEQASIRQRDASAALSDARREWGPQGGTTIQLGGLGGQFDPYDTSRGTVLPDVGEQAYSRATGIVGAYTNLKNVASNMLRGELSDEDANLARQGMEQFATRMRAAGRVLMGLSHGRITNQQMAESGIYAVDPTDIFRGDQMALNRAQSSGDTLRRELTKQDMLLRAAKPQSSQWNNIYANILTLQDALADNEFLISMFGTGARGQPAADPSNPFSSMSDEELEAYLLGGGQ